MIDDSKKYYDELSSNYENILERRESYLISIENYIRRYIQKIPQSSILDIGTGDGRRLDRMTANLNINLSAVEPSKKMFEILLSKNIDGKFMNCTIEEYPLNGSRIDVVTALWNVLGHADNINVFLSKCHSLLKSDGVLFFDVNNVLNYNQYGFYNFVKNLTYIYLFGKKKFTFKLNDIKSGGCVSMYKQNFIVATLKDIGFKSVDRIYFDYNTGSICNKFNGQPLFICRK